MNKVKGLSKEKEPLRQRQQYGDYQRERLGGWEEVEEVKGGINGDRGRRDFGW